jgi:hypothetical protein
MNFPILVFLSSLSLLAFTIRVSDALRKKAGPAKVDGRTDVALLLSATLTLLYFIIGFTFSMAISRYDLRKNCEQAEAIAINTEYSRVNLLAPTESAKVRVLLKQYLDQRVLYYITRSGSRASEIDADTAKLQAQLSSVLRPALTFAPPPVMGLLVTGMNDVVNSQQSSQAAWLNRIPLAAWTLMAAIAMGCCWDRRLETARQWQPSRRQNAAREAKVSICANSTAGDRLGAGRPDLARMSTYGGQSVQAPVGGKSNDSALSGQLDC